MRLNFLWMPLEVSALLFAPRALASSPVGLSYQAPAGCPAKQDFVAAVVTRGAHFDGEESPEPGRTMEVSVRKQGDGFVGSFQVRDREGLSKPREVNGISCTEVIDALAVVTAIALRPNADDATAVPTEDAPTSQADLPAATPTPKPAAKRFQGASGWGWGSMPVTAGTLRFDPQVSIGFNAGAAVGQFPSLVLPRFEASFHIANFVTAPSGAQRITGPIVRGHASLLGPATIHSGDTKTLVMGQAVGFGICGSPHYDSRGLILLGCLELGGGLMGLETKDRTGAKIQNKTAGFGTVGLVVEAEYSLTRGFYVGAKLGVDSFAGQITAERADGSRIFTSSSVSGYGLFGLGGHF